MMAEHALELRGVSKRFGAVQALSGVDFSAHAGEVVALVGEVHGDRRGAPPGSYDRRSDAPRSAGFGAGVTRRAEDAAAANRTTGAPQLTARTPLTANTSLTALPAPSQNGHAAS
jgi:hypothetical protein